MSSYEGMEMPMKKPIPLFKKKEVPEEWLYYKHKYGSVDNLVFHSDSDIYEVIQIGREKRKEREKEKILRICTLVNGIWSSCGNYYEGERI